MITLEVIAGPQAGATFNLSRDRIVVGRAEHAQVRLLDPEISREHAAISFEDGKWVLQDLGAINPVKVNGIVQKKCTLAPGDILQLGYNELRFDPGLAAVRTAIRGHFSRFDVTTWVAVAALVLLQVGFLVVVSVAWRTGSTPLTKVAEPEIAVGDDIAQLVAPEPVKVANDTPKAPISDGGESKPPTMTEGPKSEEAPVLLAETKQNPSDNPRDDVLAPVEPMIPEASLPVVSEVADAGQSQEAPVVAVQPVEPGPQVVEPLETTIPPIVLEPDAPPAIATITPSIAVVEPPSVTVAPPIPTPPAVQTPDPTPPAPTEEQLLDLAQKEIERGNLFGADIHLVDLLRKDPGFLAAYAERARLFEKRALFPQAIEQWDEIIKRGDSSNWTRIAREEQTRLQKVQNLLADAERLQTERRQLNTAPAVVSIPDPVRRSPAPPAPPPRAPVTPPRPPPAVVALPPQPEPTPSFPPLRLLAHGMERMPQSSPDLEDMRMLTMVLQIDERLATVRGEDIQIKVTFYDRDRSTRRVELSGVQNPGALSRLSGSLRGGEKITLTRHYAATMDLRRKQQATNKAMVYYGYRIELYHRNRLVASGSEPDALN